MYRLRNIDWFEVIMLGGTLAILLPLLVFMVMILVHVLVFGNTGLSNPTTTPAANEFCRTERHLSHLQQAGKVQVPIYKDVTICITPIPR